MEKMNQETALTTGGQSKKSKATRKTWTAEEIAYLKTNFGTQTILEMAEALGCTYSATRHQLKKMGLKKETHQWSLEDDAFLKANWGSLTPHELAEALNSSLSVIYRKAKRLNLKTTLQPRSWTEEEELYLIQHWKKKGCRHFAQKFNRPLDSIYQKANGLGLKKAERGRAWSESDEAFLKKNWMTLDVFELAKVLDRTPEAIRRRAALLNLERLRDPKKIQPWSEEEVAFLIEHWHTNSVAFICRKLKKSESGVRLKANRLKLGPKFDSGYTAKEVSRMLGYSCGSTTVRWIEKGWLKARRNKLLQNNQYCIGEKELKSFMKNHPELWSFETITFDPFYDSNATWVNQKRVSDRQKFLESLDAN